MVAASRFLNAPPLPLPRTPIVGRDRELADVSTLIQRSDIPLLTLTGPGGVGKTRLALATADALRDAFAGNVAFVPLAFVIDPERVIPAIAQTLAVAETAGQPLSASLQEAIGDAHLLLVLDNFEQTTSAAARIAPLLSACRGLKILVTSRTVLHLTGEHIYPVPSLTIAATARRATIADVAISGAGMLFLARAQAVKPDFQLTRINAPDVAAICNRLDGLPLAIELAAARMALLSPAALLERLEPRLPLLIGGAADLPVRQQTMRNTIDWSYDLLSPSKQRLFRRLAVFDGGFDLPAAEVMRLADKGMDVFEGVASLVDKSLLRSISDQEGEPRYLMLAVIREYGLEQLAAEGEESSARAAHAAWYRDYAEELGPNPSGSNFAHRMNRFTSDLGNIRDALTHFEATDDAASALRLAIATGWFWDLRGLFREGRARLDWALGRKPDVSRDILAYGLGWAGWLAMRLLDIDTAERHAQEALLLAREESDPTLLCLTLILNGGVTFERGDYEASAKFHEEALEVARAGGVIRSINSSLHNLGVVALTNGDFARARELVSESIANERIVGNRVKLATALGTLGLVLRFQGDIKGAAEHLAEQLDHYVELGLEYSWYLIGIVAADAGFATEAAQLFGADELITETAGIPPWQNEVFRETYEGVVGGLRARLGPEAFSAAWATGRALSPEQATEVSRAVLQPILAGQSDELVSPANGAFPLSPREIDVLRLIVQGRSNQQIADSLFISLTTVKAHVRSILTKLDLSSRTAAAAWAINSGLS